MDLVMIVAGLVGALVQSRYKWGYCAYSFILICLLSSVLTKSLTAIDAFGCGAQFFIWWGTLVKAPQATTAMGNDVRRSYTASGKPFPLPSAKRSSLLTMYTIFIIHSVRFGAHLAFVSCAFPSIASSSFVQKLNLRPKLFRSHGPSRMAATLSLPSRK